MPLITNTGNKKLGDRIGGLIEKSTELKFLTGYFYFSGIKELYESLKRVNQSRNLQHGFIKILVGMDVDEEINGLYEYAKDTKTYNQKEVKEAFLRSLRKAFNSEELDRREIYEQVWFFVKLLNEEKLIIRKTKCPNHSKLYLFKLQEIGAEKLFITGSSNLTKAGLRDQDEFNVEVKDYGFEEAEKYFDKLWEESVEFTADDIQKIIEVLKKETFLKEISPFHAWVYLLKTYLDLYTQASENEIDKVRKYFQEAGYKPYKYQIEAVVQSLKMCETHNGVLLADVVGMGKTVIACVVAKMLSKRGIVICPPHLMGDENKTFGWRKYLEDFGLPDWEVRSLGKLEETLEFVKKHKDIEIIIVDEAHRFRNEEIKRYHYLHEICRGKIVVLLTATPFNNRPSDIFSLLKLFTIPKKSTIVLDEDLEARFDEYENTFKKLSYIKNYYNSQDFQKKKRVNRFYKELFGDNEVDLSKVEREARNLARAIRGILEPVVIRRNRLDLKYYDEKIDISEVKDPKEWFFTLTEEQLKFYDKVIQTFYDIDEGGKFTGAIYFPMRYEKDIKEIENELENSLKEDSFMFYSQRNLYDFMRRLLVKRFESSFGAFRESVERFIKIHEYAIKFIEKTGKFILNRKLMMEIVDTDDEETVWEKIKEYEEELKKGEIDEKYHKIYEMDKLMYKEEFKKDLRNDKKIFEEIHKEFNDLGLLENDPKAQELINRIKEYLPERKVVIFTEYLDTACYLQNVLEKEFGDKLLVAVGNLSKSTVEAIYKNFDAQYEKQENQYQILLATDKLSEGFNLNRAGIVVNYDIPWNPVRVIQRVGRINRIAKKVYDEIYIANFFPTEQGADIVKSREIAQNKMFMIHKVLGEDAKIFSPDEEPQPATLYRKLTEYKEDEEESFLAKLRKDFEEIKRKHPEILEVIKDMPTRIKLAKRSDKDELFVFIKKANDLFIAYKDYQAELPDITSFEEIYEKIKVENKDAEKLPLSENFWESYYQIIERKFKKQYRTGGIDTPTKALNLLKTLQPDERLKPYQEFISSLIDDIDVFGTLSEYILSEIVNWQKYLDKSGEIRDLDELEKEIEKLKSEIGEDFIERSKKYFKNVKETVIIAIENQKGKNNERQNTS